MEEVTVNKAELLEALRANREDHRKIFEEALVGYAKEAQAELREHLKRLAAGKRRNIYIQKIVPEDHTRDYDTAIRMFEMALGETVVLKEKDFRQYVMDDWGWAKQFSNH